MGLSTERIREALENGLLSFPITDMDDDGKFDPTSYKNRIKWFLEHSISAIFVAGGTGEFFSLSQAEYEQITDIAAKTTDQKIPVVASAGRSIPEAIAFTKIAEQAGIDAILLMPPYLVQGPEDGTFEYAKRIIQSTNLPIIYYNRANGILTTSFLERLAHECPNFIGLKDGTGNIQNLNDTIKSLDDRLSYIGGVPTAEIIAEAYLSIGVNTYSSAVFNFVPDLALQFYASLRSGDNDMVNKLLKAFYIPFVRLRGNKNGYAVSLIKAGARIIGRDAGNVRSPLVMPNHPEVDLLGQIIRQGESVLL